MPNSSGDFRGKGRAQNEYEEFSPGKGRGERRRETKLSLVTAAD